LGFSLRPPSWLRNAASSFIHVATQAKTTVDAANQANKPVSLTPTTVDTAGAPSGDMPDWLIPVALGAVALLVLPKVLKGR
jgi:hypothetical protein